MRHLIFNISIAFIALLTVTGCRVDEPSVEMSEDAIKVVGVPVPFADATKSVMSETESYINNMALYVFDSNGDKVDYQFIESSKPLFIIDRESDTYKNHTQSLLESCTLCILANIPEEDETLLESVSTFADLMSADCTIAGALRESGIRTAGGLPMIGIKDEVEETGGSIDLRYTSDALKGSVLQLHLNTFMAKLRFNITVDPVQKSDFVQRFEIKSWTVENIPTLARVDQPDGTDESEHRNGPFFSSAFTFGNVDNGVNPVMQGASTAMSFWCYVPEHRVLPGGTATYPENITDDAKQNFKPDWLEDGDRPVKVTLKGIYTDHRNVEREVEYTIYPGADNWKDFYIERGCEYVSNISIKGITNTKYGAQLSVSLDQRVDVKQNDFTFELERETLLDSHWEIRPIRITLDPSAHPEADRVEVEIISGDMNGSNPWIRFEMPTTSQISSSAASYCDVTSSSLAYGKRRYFTTDLVTETLKDNKLVTINASDASNCGIDNTHTIWVYVDENTNLPSAPGSDVRKATVQCRYYIDGQTDPKVVENYYFQQKSLHNITYNSHTYGIEYFEEYLHNFDGRDNYGVTTDGMAWGLDGTQLSYEDRAIYFSGGFLSGIVNSLIETIDQNLRVYDFYLSTAESADGTIGHPLAGHRFTRRIANKVGVGQLATNASANSAIEYCVNKNKRNASTGKVGEVLWYLPSIDEMEEICKGGYSDFDVFQDKYYWSSQPAYQVYNWSYTSPENNGNGQMYLDNKNRARATKVDNSFNTVNSGQSKTSAEYSYALNRPFLSGTVQVTGPTPTGNTPQYEPGNQLRTAVNRIRCVYRVLKSYTSTFGFETSTAEGIWTSSDLSRNTGTKRSGNASGYFSVSSGWGSANGTATVVTSQYLYAPSQLSFYVRYSGDKPSSSTWTVYVSADNSTWTQVSSYTTLSTSFSLVSVDLSAYQDVYVRIQNSTTVPGAFSGNTTNLFIDDIQLTYSD